MGEILKSGNVVIDIRRRIEETQSVEDGIRTQSVGTSY